MIMQRIGIRLGDIGALHDGLGGFAPRIGMRIAAKAPQSRHNRGIAVDFHARDAVRGLFGDGVDPLGADRRQRDRQRRADAAQFDRGRAAAADLALCRQRLGRPPQ